MIRAVALSVSCFLLFLAVHALLFHFKKVEHRARVLFKLFLANLSLYLLIGFVILGERENIQFMIAGLVLNLFLYFNYLQFYFIADRSISLRLMMELEKCPEKKMSYEQMRQLYYMEYVFKRRFVDMVYGGYLTEKDGYYKNTRKTRRAIKLFKPVIHFLKLPDG